MEQNLNQDTYYRKIIHVDMDAFYASVEQRDHPELRGKPIAVGGSGSRGVVAAASYEARKFGVRSAMPSVTAARLCPDLIFVRHRFDQYRQVSREIREIFFEYTDLVEPLSLDEAYLDVTTNKKGMISATKIAQEIRAKIWDKTHLTASAGISINKFLAKVASDINKPNGLTLIPPDRAESFLEKLSIDKFYGIGKVTAGKMHRLGIHTGGDLKNWTEAELAHRFGKMGRHFYRIVRAIDDREVKPNRPRKSVGAENTFNKDITLEGDMLDRLRPLAQKVSERISQANDAARTITLKIKYHDFVLTTRSRTLDRYVSEFEEIFPVIQELLHQPAFPEKAIRLLGVYLSNLAREKEEEDEPKSFVPVQLTLEF
ncbi:MAG: DNA polymerase IV [Bacteroidetes bacterium]|nr:DNA polymerase IV [Bacteroidota bacterium]